MPARGAPVWALYVITVAIWGSSWYGIKEQLGVVAPTVSLAYRFLLAAAILWVFCLLTRRSLRFPAASHVWMALQALCLFCGNYILFYYAGFHVVSGLLALCFSTIPLMNVLNAAFFLRQPVDRNVIAPSLVSLAGLVLVFLPEFMEKGLGSSPLIGFALSMLATYLASLGNVLSVKLKSVNVPVVQANAWGMTYGGLFCVLFALVSSAAFNYDPRTSYTVSLILLAVFASVIGFGTYLTLVQRIGAGRAGFSSVLFPLVALSISTVFEDHHWSPLAGAGVVLVLSGNLILLLRRRVPAPAPQLQKGPRPMNTTPRPDAQGSDRLAFQLRPEIKTLPDSGIVEVWKMGFTVPDVIGLWVGEGDLPTTRFICDAAAKSLSAGETFYTYKGGIPELRQALSEYYRRHWNIGVSDERIIVTSSGMNAMVLIVQTLCGAGDNAVCVTPVWPNIFAAIQVMGAEPRQVALTGDEKGWHLDIEKLFAACDARTKAIYLASPGNPTGWVMPEEQRRALLDFARKRRIAIIADEVYARLTYDRPVAPSFLEIATPDDPVFVVNSFSKTWAMTGWRVGWIVAPQAITHKLEMLIEYNTSGGQTFTQRACVAALNEGEEWVKWMVERCRQSRDVVINRVAQMNRVQVIPAQAAFYLMLRVEDMGDATGFCKRLVVDGRVGLAPGTAFGAGGEQYVRLCYAQSPERIGLAMDRLAKFLSDR